MKKIFAVLLSVILLASCGNAQKAITKSEEEKILSSLNRDFDMKAQIKMGDFEAQADVNRTKEGMGTVKITNPKNLSGLTFSFDKEEVTVSFLGLSMKLNHEDILDSSLTKALFSSINKACTPHGVTLSAKGDIITAVGETESGDFSVSFDRKDKSLLSLKIPDLDLECSFQPL